LIDGPAWSRIKESEMSLSVDRLWPVHFDYKGNKLTIEFVWAVGRDVPTALCINLTGANEGELARLGEIKKNWTSFEEAVDVGEETAKSWVDSLEASQVFSN
jgi:hypothetical protein